MLHGVWRAESVGGVEGGGRRELWDSVEGPPGGAGWGGRLRLLLCYLKDLYCVVLDDV